MGCASIFGPSLASRQPDTVGAGLRRCQSSTQRDSRMLRDEVLCRLTETNGPGALEQCRRFSLGDTRHIVGSADPSMTAFAIGAIAFGVVVVAVSVWIGYRL